MLVYSDIVMDYWNTEQSHQSFSGDISAFSVQNKKRPTVSAFQHCNIYLGCKNVALNFHTEGGFVTGTDSNV